MSTMNVNHIRALLAKAAADDNARRQPIPPVMPATAPPPYEDSDDSDDEDDNPSNPLHIVVNAANVIEGNHNLVPTTSTSPPFLDAMRFTGALLQNLKQLNAEPARQKGIKVHLTLNCGITIHGDRNVVGNVGVRPRAAAAPQSNGAAAQPACTTAETSSATAPGPPTPISPLAPPLNSVTASAKRKAEDYPAAEAEAEAPPAKRLAVHADSNVVKEEPNVE